MTEATDAYREACKRRDDAFDAVVHACLPVIVLAQSLQSYPHRVHVTGIPQSVGVAEADLAFDGTQWPTATAIHNALAAYHTALSETQTAWVNVQIRAEAHGLRPPEGDGWEAIRRELRNRASRERR